MTIVMKYAGTAGTIIGVSDDIELGAYLAEYDVDAHDGRGFARWTVDRDEGIQFDDLEHASAAWRKQSSVRPWRRDGMLNRPLTAFSVIFERLEEGLK